MANNNEEIQILSQRLNDLITKHQFFTTEIKSLHNEIIKLKNTIAQETTITPINNSLEAKPILEANNSSEKHLAEKPQVLVPMQGVNTSQQNSRNTNYSQPKTKNEIEKFIGENIISKIGIAITIIGVAIGAKYSIENNLISPATRILLGYAMGFLLLGVGLKLKKNYLNFSAVLVSGALAILYFITFFAYNFYQLLPQEAAFGIMVAITALGVFTALKYNQHNWHYRFSWRLCSSFFIIKRPRRYCSII